MEGYKLQLDEYRTTIKNLKRIKNVDGTAKNIVTIEEISQRCQATEDYVSKIDRNFKELKESCTKCLQYNNKVISMYLGPDSVAKSIKQLESMAENIKLTLIPERSQKKYLQ